MVEVFVLIVSLTVIGATAKKRGGSRVLWILIGLFGYVIASVVSLFFLGPLYILGGLAWLGLTLAGAYWLTGGFRSAEMTWMCPDCGLLNDPSTLVCGCGKHYDELRYSKLQRNG